MSTAPATPGPGKTSQPTTRPRLDEDGRRERLEAFHATLSAQVLSLTTSQAWTAWLGTAARFHHYSTLNTVAIWAQRSDATQVAGYRVWQSMGRQVRKGEQGIQILAPVTRRPDQDGPDGRDKDHDSARPGGVLRAASCGAGCARSWVLDPRRHPVAPGCPGRVGPRFCARCSERGWRSRPGWPRRPCFAGPSRRRRGS